MEQQADATDEALLNNFSLSLPLLTDPPDAETSRTWHGFTALADDSGRDAAEPDAPQGEYSSAGGTLSVPEITTPVSSRPVELLAPAGGPEAAFAAFHYGADAIYLGLKKFRPAGSRKLYAGGTGRGHRLRIRLQPRRRVFVTINTLIRQDELAELVETLAALVEISVRAVILQDLGVYHLIRRYFPSLELHASTQLAVHNRAGAETLRQLGFSRVVLARELTFEEVHDVTASAGIETEVFIHAAMLFLQRPVSILIADVGPQRQPRQCAYSCRDSYHVTGAPET